MTTAATPPVVSDEALETFKARLQAADDLGLPVRDVAEVRRGKDSLGREAVFVVLLVDDPAAGAETWPSSAVDQVDESVARLGRESGVQVDVFVDLAGRSVFTGTA